MRPAPLVLSALCCLSAFLHPPPTRAQASDSPSLFATSETRSEGLEPFPKWLGIIQGCGDDKVLAALLPEPLRAEIAPYKTVEFTEKLKRVNDIVNRQRYRSDTANWGRRDYWSTPEEFLRHGGNCEEFAVTKYLALRYLAVPASLLRVVVVEDLNTNAMHAILAAYETPAIWILDNQHADVRRSSAITTYRAVYSINENFWWMHQPLTVD